MNPARAHEDHLVRYLLGRLSGEERDRLEARLFTEEGLHVSLRATADDLIAAYLRGELVPEDRLRFESHFLASPRGRARVRFVGGVLSAVTDPAAAGAAGPRPSVTWRPWAAAALVLLAIGALLLLRRRPELQSTAAIPSLASPTAAPTGAVPPVPATVVPAPRTVDLPRTPGPVQVALSSETRLLRLQVPVPAAGPPSYDAVIRRPDGSEVWRAEDLAPARGGAPVVVDIPARVLVAGDYRLALEGEAVREASGTSTVVLEFPLHIRRP
jgi:anti-sigma factor RsiW